MEITKKHIITVAGGPGSGKSTAAKNVAASLGFDHLSGGDLYRAAGKERGLDILQANHANEKSGEIDTIVDKKMSDINAQGDRIVIDSRTAWHFIPTSFKVFLSVDPLIAATRILAGIDEARFESEHIPHNPAEYAEQLKDRLASEVRRYDHLYGINPYDLSNYDLVIDTAVSSVEETATTILKGFEDWIATQPN